MWTVACLMPRTLLLKNNANSLHLVVKTNNYGMNGAGFVNLFTVANRIRVVVDDL